MEHLRLFLLLFSLAGFLVSCGTTKSALRTYDDLRWAKNNYHAKTLSLFREVFFLQNRDLRNAGVYYLRELYFDLKVTPLSKNLQAPAETKDLQSPPKSFKDSKLSAKQINKRNENKLAKAKIISLLKEHFVLETDFNVKNVILKFIATLGAEQYWLEDTHFLQTELSKNALFIAKAIDDPNPLVARYAIELLANENHLTKYKGITIDSQQLIVQRVKNYYHKHNENLGPVLAARIYQIIAYFDPNSDLLKTIEQQFNFLVLENE